MEGLMKALFGKGFDFGQEGIMGMLGSEGFSSLLKGGADLMTGLQTGDMLDFQKDLASKADARTDTLFNQDQEDREYRQNLNFG